MWRITIYGPEQPGLEGGKKKEGKEREKWQTFYCLQFMRGPENL